MEETPAQAATRRNMTRENLILWEPTLDEKKAHAVILIGMCIHGKNKGVPTIASGMHEIERVKDVLRTCLSLLETGEVIHEHK